MLLHAILLKTKQSGDHTEKEGMKEGEGKNAVGHWGGDERGKVVCKQLKLIIHLYESIQE